MSMFLFLLLFFGLSVLWLFSVWAGISYSREPDQNEGVQISVMVISTIMVVWTSVCMFLLWGTPTV